VDLHLDEAREEAGSRLGSRSIDWHEIDAKDFQAPPGSFDLVMCVGSSHALGGLQPALAAMARFTKPGGRAILGEGFWAEPPSQAALEALGADPEDLEDFDSIMALAEQHGFRPSYVAVSDQGEWDRYERAWCRGIEFFCAQHPDDPEAPALLDLARDHREGYETGYRGVLGFVTCLFELPAA
jgi:SAM-dependent methyltransferase